MKEKIDDEDIVYFAKLHWVLFAAPILCLLIAIALVFWPPVYFLGLILGVFSILWVLMTWVTYHFSSITIKKKQVILRTGVIVRQTVDMPLSKIETIDIRQSIVGTIFRYGSLVITGTGGTRHLINYLQRPLTCRRYIEQLMNDQSV